MSKYWEVFWNWFTDLKIVALRTPDKYDTMFFAEKLHK